MRLLRIECAVRTNCTNQVALMTSFSTIRLMSFPGASNLPFWFAQDYGLFARHGLQVEFVTAANSVDQVRALYDDRADVLCTAFDNVVAYMEGQSEVQLPGPADLFAFLGVTGGMNSVLAAPDIKAFSDIGGKVIAVDAQRTGFALALYEILELKGGLIFGKDYTTISVGGTDARLEALRQGKAVAGVIGAPQDLVALAEGFRRIADIAEVFGAYQGNVLVTRRAWASGRKRELNAMAQAIIEAQNKVFCAETSAIEALLRHSKKMTQNDAALMYQRLIGFGGLSKEAAIDRKGVDTVLRIRAKFGKPQKSLGQLRDYVDTF